MSPAQAAMTPTPMDFNIGNGVLMPPEIPQFGLRESSLQPPFVKPEKVVKKSILPPINPYSFKTGTVADDEMFEFSTENNFTTKQNNN